MPRVRRPRKDGSHPARSPLSEEDIMQCSDSILRERPRRWLRMWISTAFLTLLGWTPVAQRASGATYPCGSRCAPTVPEGATSPGDPDVVFRGVPWISFTSSAGLKFAERTAGWSTQVVDAGGSLQTPSLAIDRIESGYTTEPVI